MSGAPENPWPLEADLAALLDRERTAAAPREPLTRVRARLALSVGAGAASADPSGEQPSSTQPGATRRGPALPRLPLAPLAIAFLAGGLAGAGALTLLRSPPREHVVYVDRPAVAPVIEAPAPTSGASRAPVEPAPPPAVPPVAPPGSAGGAPRHPARTEVPAVSPLRAEREVLDRARSSLSEGDAAGALALLDRHASEFPQALLAEEREALAVQSLVIAGRYDDARGRAARFRAAWPGSLFLPAVDASLASIP
ncbi:MAG: hypothetical protein ACRENE_01980 [Polyangiaceae bacterium]